MAMFGFPHWQLKSTSTESGVVAPDERLPFAQTAVMGVQHAVAMFGATVLMPILMGLDPNLSILMSGIGTLLFFFITGGRVPSYLGSSAAFVGVVIAATGFNGQGINPNISIALGGIIACGLVYTVIGLVVMKIGTRWIERLMPPVVTGAVVMAIGLNLAPIAVKSVSASAFDSWMAVMTVLCIGLVAVFTRGMIQRLLILVGLIVACLLYGVMTNVLGLGKAVDYTLVSHAAWFGLPHFSTPAFNGQAMMLIAPVAVILVAENSPIKTVADLKGHKVAFQKGSSSHNLLLRALRQAGLKFTDIQPTYLTPADARAAFQQGNVDAWAIWDPYYSAALLQGGVRVLKDGTDLNQTGSFYLAARPYAEKNGAFIQGVLTTFSEADALTRSQREQSIALLAKTMGLPAPVIASYLDHRPPTTIKPLSAEVAALQQQTADLFYENRLVPKKVDIRQRIWQPTQLEGKQL